MKRSVMGLCLLLVLLVLSMLTAWSMDRVHRPVGEALDQAAAFCRGERWPQALEQLEKAKNTWERSRKWTACLADHGPMEEIDGLFARLEVYARQREVGEFAAACAELAKKCRSMAQAHGLALESFL